MAAGRFGHDLMTDGRDLVAVGRNLVAAGRYGTVSIAGVLRSICAISVVHVLREHGAVCQK